MLKIMRFVRKDIKRYLKLLEKQDLEYCLVLDDKPLRLKELEDLLLKEKEK